MISHPTQFKLFESGFKWVLSGHFVTAIFKHLFKSQWLLVCVLDRHCQEKHLKATVLRFFLCWYTAAHFISKILNALKFDKSYQKVVSTAALEQ